MADLSSLMSVAPITGAGMIGRQDFQNRQTEAIKQQELQQLIQARMQEADQKQQMNPLLLQHQGLVNKGLDAGLPGIAADARLKGTTADLAQGTLGSTIAATNSGNQAKVSKDQGQMSDDMTKFFTDASQQLRLVPPVQRMGALTQMLQAAGKDINHPQAQQWLKQLGSQDAQHLPDIMSGLAEHIGQTQAAADPKLNNAVRTTQMNNDANKQIHAGNNAATIRAAEIAAEARKATSASKGKATDLLSQVQAGKLSYEKAAVAFDVMSHYEQDPDLKQKYAEMAQRFNQAKLDDSTARGAGKADLPSLGITATPDKKPVLGGAGGPKHGTAENPIVLK